MIHSSAVCLAARLASRLRARLAARPLVEGPSALLLAAALLAPGPAQAWDKEIHRSIAEAAIQISPEAEARLPLGFRDALLKEAAEADYLDRECRFHASTAPPRDPAAEAEKMYLQLLDPKKIERPYARAQAIGRYLHFVADAVVPASMRQGDTPKTLNYFANRNFVLFREPQALSMPLSAALRARAASAAWGGTEEAGKTMFFRNVVNLAVDALCLLPLRAPMSPGAVSPVIFIVNRMDNGVAAAKRSGYVVKEREEMTDIPAHGYNNITTGTRTTWEITYEEHGGGASVKKPNMLEISGVQIVEMLLRSSATPPVMRVLLFNNSPHCAADVALKIGTWRWPLPETMPPGALRLVEVALPESLVSRHLTSTSRVDTCAGPQAPGKFVLSDKRLVVGNTGAAPRFVGVAEEIDLSHRPGTS
ncbi:MAG: hypothetical protein ABIT01_06975 [Thermoanaerobaculia bacterium]